MDASSRLVRPCLLAGVLLVSPVGAAHAAEPVVSVWYRGTPAGIPRQDDLALIRSLGFTGVTWPASSDAVLPVVRRMASTVGLQVLVEPDDASEDSLVMRSAERLRVRVDRAPASDLPALVWGAVASGARLISFDAYQRDGHGLAEANGQERAWVRPAVTLARQLSANAVLFDQIQPGPAVAFESGRPAGVAVALFSTPRAWVFIATNTGTASAHVVARFPPTVRYALWVSLLDSSSMSMLSEPAGPRWTVDLARGAAAVYLIDR